MSPSSQQPQTTATSYTPPCRVLERYAQVLVRFALWGGKGIRKGEVVYLVGAEATKPLFLAVRREILKAGGNVISNFIPESWDRWQFSRDFFELAKPHQLDWTPKRYFRGLVDEMTHYIYLLGEDDPRELEGIDPKKIMRAQTARKIFMDWRTQKELEGKLTWTLALYGTEGYAKEAGMSLKEYWRQIIRACFLDEADPVARWRAVQRQIDHVVRKLNKLTPVVDHLMVEGLDVRLKIVPGEKRSWLGGSGRNIPSFEVFTSPDWRGTEGWIRFNQPLYRQGVKIEGIELWFEKGRVVKARSRTNEAHLKAMLKVANADKVGEFSLTDRRLSRITKFMANTLYDENVGGRWGNMHIALGKAYRDAHDGNPAEVSEEEWQRLGYNDSAVHTDIISTTRRRVTAHLKQGGTLLLYADGEFVV
ncbi:aminopeptidase [Candidatus Parcubacteria bacterium]|nr:MAG: aminopeptidase [Candidatus Parcubacteria bacterium]GIW68777.1 MAG: aminopeptidase [Candidatus Parcubacteria bacterium]